MRIWGNLGLLVGVVGVSAYLFAQPTALTFSPGWKLILCVSAAVLALIYVVDTQDHVNDTTRARERWRTAVRQAWRPGLALAPLALLPVVPDWAAGLLMGGALVGYVLAAGTSAVRGQPAAHRGQALAPASVAILVFCLGIALLYVQIAARTDGNFQNDSAYYFGVAKHMAVTGRFESPIVWHFLRKPAGIPTAPFDYWGGLTSVVLVPFLALLGRTQQVANVVMAIVSAGSVFIFGYLIAVHQVVRNRLVGGALVVAFALAPALHTYRFDTESVALYHLLVLLALLLALQKRWAWASLCAGLLYHVRPDALFVTFIFWAWALYEARRAGTLKRVGIVQCVVVGATLLYGAIAFGAPLGVRMQAIRLENQLDLYFWGSHPHAPLLASRLAQEYLSARAGEVVHTLAGIVPGGALLLGLVVTAGGLPGRRRPPAERGTDLAIWSLGLPAAVLVGLASGPMFVPWRTLHPFIPLVLLGGGRALDALLERLHQWRGAVPWARCAAAVALIGLTLGATLRSVSVYGFREKAVIRPAELELRRLDPLLHGQVVASNLPWYVIANTNSPAVSIPIDGVPAVAQALARYGVHWVILIGSARTVRASAAAFPPRESWSIGRFRLKQRLAAGGLRLMEVVRAQHG